jgi:hypothetical protein
MIKDRNSVESKVTSHFAAHVWWSSTQSSLKQERTMLTSISPNSNWTTVALIGLVATFLVTFQDARAAQPKQLTKKEVVALITTAKSPEDHMRLARYYKAEADRLEVEAKDHDELAATYRTSIASQAAAEKMPMAANTAAHCESFAKSVRDAANADRELAASHEQMAKDAAANHK